MERLVSLLQNWSNRIRHINEIEVKEVYSDPNDRSKTFVITNNHLREFKTVLFDIFQTLKKDVRFTQFGKNKIVIVSGYFKKGEFFIHHNVFMKPYMTFEEYWKEIEDDIFKHYGNGYPLDEIVLFKVRVWNVDNYLNKNIQRNGSKNRGYSTLSNVRYIHTDVKYRNVPIVKYHERFKDVDKSKFINPLKNTKVNSKTLFACADIETMKYQGVQIPVIITSCSNGAVPRSKAFVIKHELLMEDVNLALSILWEEYFDFVLSGGVKTIFVHNLGSFDGYFIYKGLINYNKEHISNVRTIIDDQNDFISISYKFKDKTFNRFGRNKIIIVSGFFPRGEFFLHQNVLINPLTTFQEYWNEIEGDVFRHYADGYPLDELIQFRVQIWNADSYLNKGIKGYTNKYSTKIRDRISLPTIRGIRQIHTAVCYKDLPIVRYHIRFNDTEKFKDKFIRPLKKRNVNKKPFLTTDLETIKYGNIQIPVIITTCFKGTCKSFVIDHNLIKTDLDLATLNLWKQYFDYILNLDIKTIFVHNLGSFDGYFIYKGLLNYCSDINNVKTIIDDKHEFILINLKHGDKNYVWRDSNRIFGVSLNQLCKVFNVPGKTQKYDPTFNYLSVFDNLEKMKVFMEYALQDSKALYEAMYQAQELYINIHKVDICSIVSTSTLSLKIFRKHFLNVDLPILSNWEDGFIREGYFGGATDYYKAYAKNLKYYDVNSLYPFAMSKPMPHKISYFIKDMSNMDLNDFFGYCKVKVTCPDTMLRPVLPYKLDNRLVFPTGTWTGVYFSEELKAVKDIGYKIELISGYEFSKEYIFNDYVNHFYKIKKSSVGPERWIANGTAAP